MLIDEQILDDYHRDGVVCLRGLFEPKWIEVLREGVERNLREGVERNLREGVERNLREGVERNLREPS